ncbi:hypothetical protein BS50DRAFT_593566 [Corynespora cassiicola Philippines]|uniref:Uncharacterized protein n=1 Tax=Corynespora cassiicola Philippines TaxID=1448308 RepID=A0A2T2N5Y3_CORCC|nr:hypothetical protein BS50DRAFT_593566 [Corynespora cassiicola Philippines]
MPGRKTWDKRASALGREGKRYGNPDAKSNHTPPPSSKCHRKTERRDRLVPKSASEGSFGSNARPHAAEFQRDVQHRSPCASPIRCSRPASQSVSVLRLDLLRMLLEAEIHHAKNRTAPHRSHCWLDSIRLDSQWAPFRSGPKEVAGQDAEARHADSAPQASVCRARLGAGTAPVGRTWREMLCNAASLVALGKVLGGLLR